SLLSRFNTTNPTWLKVPRSPSARLRPSSLTVRSLFRSHVNEMATELSNGQPSGIVRTGPDPVCIRLADSRSLPLEDHSVDAIICSPPYCTRIDYAIATRPELALLGLDAQALRRVREKMIGTATINSEQPTSSGAWGSRCNAFLERVRKHTSRASESYYWKN